MKAFVKDTPWDFNTKHVQYNDSNGNVVSFIEGLKYDLLKVVCEQMNMTSFHVLTPKGFEMENVFVNDFIFAMLAKEASIV
jgi:hypothetical protein